MTLSNTPAKTIGILGNGQLGRMLCESARALGYRTHVFGPGDHAPAHAVSDEVTTADYSDPEALKAFGGTVDVVTLEFENIPAESLKLLEQYAPVHPNPNALRVAQNRLLEKEAFVSLQIKTTPFLPINTAEDLWEGLQQFKAQGLRGGAILKTCELGYDGKGQWAVFDGFKNKTEVDDFWSTLPNIDPSKLGDATAPFILEARQFLQSECSVIVARNAANETVALGPFENHHVDGILDWSRYPAPHLPQRIKVKSIEDAKRLARELNIIGLLCVEFFVVDGPNSEPVLMANEMAPRPHNSGHLTQHWGRSALCITPLIGDSGQRRDKGKNGSKTPSQFDWHIAALMRPEFPETWKQANMDETVSGAMVNLLGDIWYAEGHAEPYPPDWSVLETSEQLRLYLYDKAEARPGRKMGHLNMAPTNLVKPDADTLDGYVDTLLKARYQLRQSVQPSVITN